MKIIILLLSLVMVYSTVKVCVFDIDGTLTRSIEADDSHCGNLTDYSDVNKPSIYG